MNDPAIAELNPALSCPTCSSHLLADRRIGHEFHFSPTTCRRNRRPSRHRRNGQQVNGHSVRAQGNEGVTAVVQQTEGGFGYVEQSYADNNACRADW